MTSCYVDANGLMIRLSDVIQLHLITNTAKHGVQVWRYVGVVSVLPVVETFTRH